VNIKDFANSTLQKNLITRFKLRLGRKLLKMIQIKPLLDICGIVYSEKQLVLLQKNLLQLLKKVVEKITSERKVLDEKRVKTPPKRPEIHFIEGKKYKSRKCKDAEDIEIALKLIYQSKNEKKICEKEKDILKTFDANIF